MAENCWNFKAFESDILSLISYLKNCWNFKAFRRHDILYLMLFLKNVENLPRKNKIKIHCSNINTFHFQGVFSCLKVGFHYDF